MRLSPILLAAALLSVAGCYNPALQSPGYYCHANDVPSCPDGQLCVNGRCASTSGPGALDMSGGLIPKTASYTGIRQDPMLNDATMCPDAPIEMPPNDDTSNARSPGPVMPGSPPVIIGMLSICPAGLRAETGKHDRDFIAIDTSTTSGQLTLKADITYDVKYGDLDIGIMDSTGNMIAIDNSATSNGCVLTGVTQGIFYVVVVGALDVDSNRYTLKVQTAQVPNQLSCTVMSNPDMAL